MITAIVLLVLVGIVLLAVGLIALTDPEGRGGRVALACGTGVIGCVAAIAWVAFGGA